MNHQKIFNQLVQVKSQGMIAVIIMNSKANRNACQSGMKPSDVDSGIR